MRWRALGRPEQLHEHPANAVCTRRAGDHQTKAAAKAQPWPKDVVDQVRAVADVLAASAQPLSVDDIAAHFSSRGAWKKRLPPLLDMLVALGRAQERRGRYMDVK